MRTRKQSLSNMKFILKWQVLLSLIILVGITMEVQSQKRRVEDKDWLDIPYFEMDVPDSTRLVKFYSGNTQKILRHDEEPGNMKLYAELIFDKMGRQEELRYFRSYDGRSFATYRYAYPNDSSIVIAKKGLSKKEHEWFLQDSTIVKEIMYKKNGKPKYIWTYDHLNDTLLSRIKKEKANGKVLYTWVNSIDTVKKELRLNKYVKNELVNSIVYLFDSLGYKMKGVFDHDGVRFLSSNLQIPQDSIVHISVEKLCNAHPSQTFIYKHTLDTLGRIVNEVCQTGFDGRVYDYTYSYNVLNQIAEIYSLGSSGDDPLSVEIKYNENGDALEKKIFSQKNDKKQIAKLIWKYDKDGFMTKSLEVFNSGPYSYSSCEMIKYIKWVSVFE